MSREIRDNPEECFAAAMRDVPEGSIEVLRIWFRAASPQGTTVAVLPFAIGSGDLPPPAELWGLILRDAANQIARAYAAETTLTFEEAMAKIRAEFTATIHSREVD